VLPCCITPAHHIRNTGAISSVYTIQKRNGSGFSNPSATTSSRYGAPVRPEDWGRRNIPWYFIAADRGSEDEAFVSRKLPRLSTFSQLTPVNATQTSAR